MKSKRTSEIIIQESPYIPTADQDVEIVERKGKGHPDTICDAISERISIELSKAYQQTFGRILHHNIDKGMLVAGQVDCRLGGGKVLEPMRLIIGDRAAIGVGKKTIPVSDITKTTARKWFKENLPHVDPSRHVRYQVELKPSSTELSGIFQPEGQLLGANDTSAAVGYAPYTPAERLVLDVEQFLNGPLFKKEFPETGEDVKVMALRQEKELSLTVAMPILAHTVKSESAYFDCTQRVVKSLRQFVNYLPHGGRKVRVTLNALDSPGKGEAGMYLTLLGTSAEQGDSGQVGRGNRVCGVIALNRPMSGEAAAGKNPVSHVGKIYNVLAHELAGRIYSQVSGVTEVTVWLLSVIGRRIDRPSVAAVHVNLAKGALLRHRRDTIQQIIRKGLQDVGPFCEALAEGRYSVY